MKRKVLLQTTVFAVFAWFAASALSQRITAEFKETSLEEVLRELGRQTGYDFSMTWRFTTERDWPKITATFRDEPLKRALEKIFEQLPGRTFRRIGPTAFRVLTQAAPAKLPGTETEGGYRICVRSLDFSVGKQEFGRGVVGQAQGLEAEPRMTVELVVDAPDDDSAAAVFGLGEEITIADSTGRKLPLCDPSPFMRTSAMLTTLTDPSEILAKLDVAFPSLEAQTLTISGSLVLWRKCERVELELPWGQEGAVAQAHGISLRVDRVVTLPNGQASVTISVDQPPSALPLSAPMPRMSMSENRFTLQWPDKRTSPLTQSMAFWDNKQVVTITGPSGPANAPTSVIYTTYLKEDPTVVVPFTIEGIPLPTFPEWAASLAGKTAEATAPKKKHAYWVEEGGGAIEFDVRIDDRPLTGPVTIGVSLTKKREGLDVGESAQWREVIDQDGHVRITNIRPGAYIFTALISSLGGLPTPVVNTRLAELYGIRWDSYTWINTQAHITVEAGKKVILEPVRFVPAVVTIRPKKDSVVSLGELVFAWEPYPGAAAYRVSLGAWDGQEGVTFWVSDPTPQTSLRYDPASGRLCSEAYRALLDLDPGMKYYWWVSALDERGKTISQAHGGGYFQVK